MDPQTQQQFDDFMAGVNKQDFIAQSYVKKIDKPWGYELHFPSEDLPYVGKILHLDEGKRTSLQVHDRKRESWWLASGNISLQLEKTDGEMDEFQMDVGKGYNCHIGQKHRLIGGQGGGDVFEVSTPEIGITYRIEDDYDRDHEDEEDRSKRDEEAPK